MLRYRFFEAAEAQRKSPQSDYPFGPMRDRKAHQAKLDAHGVCIVTTSG
jgi:hypothetical protein